MKVNNGIKSRKTAVVQGEPPTPAAAQPGSSRSSALAGLPPRPATSNASNDGPSPTASTRKGSLTRYRRRPAVPDIDAKNRDGVTALVQAIIDGKTVTALQLLEQPVRDPTIRLQTLSHGCYEAALQGNIDILKALLQTSGIDWNTKALVSGETPLHAATWSDNADAVKLLLEGKQIKNPGTDQNGWSALHYAAQYSDSAIFKLLLETGGFNHTGKTITGLTPLSIACRTGKTELVSLLLSQKDIDCNEQDTSGQTPLFLASQRGRADVVGLLLKTEGVQVNLPNNSGATPLQVAIRHGHLNIVKALLAHEHIDVNAAPHHAVDAVRSQPAESGDSENTVALLERMAIDPNNPSVEVAPPLYIAAANGHEGIVKLLAERPELDFDRRYQGRTAIDAAKTPAIAQALLDARTMAAMPRDQAIDFDRSEAPEPPHLRSEDFQRPG